MGQAYSTNGTSLSLGTHCKTDKECLTVSGITAADPAYVCCMKSRFIEFGPTTDSIR